MLRYLNLLPWLKPKVTSQWVMGLDRIHHAFTSPKPEYFDTFDTNPGEALATPTTLSSTAMKSVSRLNSYPQPGNQKRVFKVMGISEEDAKRSLASCWTLSIRRSTGGIAFGWDRMISLLAGTDSIETSLPSRRPATATTH